MKIDNRLVARTHPSAGTPALFKALRREVDRLFSDFADGQPVMPAAADVTPRIDIIETDGTLKVTAELPGIDEKDVEVTLRDNVLTISGTKHTERNEKDDAHHLVERSSGHFSRILTLPAGVDPDKVEARMKKGILTVSFDKAPASQIHKIRVQ